MKGSAEAKLVVDNFWQSFTYEEKKTKEHPGPESERLLGLRPGREALRARRRRQPRRMGHRQRARLGRRQAGLDRRAVRADGPRPLPPHASPRRATRSGPTSWSCACRTENGFPPRKSPARSNAGDSRRFRFARPAVWAIMPASCPAACSASCPSSRARCFSAPRRRGRRTSPRPKTAAKEHYNARHVVLRPRPVRRRDQGIRGRLPAEERPGVPLQPGAVVPAGRQPRAGGALLQDVPALRAEGAEPRRHRGEDQDARSSWSRRAAGRRRRRRPPHTTPPAGGTTTPPPADTTTPPPGNEPTVNVPPGSTTPPARLPRRRPATCRRHRVHAAAARRDRVRSGPQVPHRRASPPPARAP